MTLERLGYIRIRSSILKCDVYIVKHIDVSVPDTTLLKFNEEEVAYLKKLKKSNKLDDEQLRVLTMAKEEFGGSIIDVTKEHGSKFKRKRARTSKTPRQESVYEKPRSWNLKPKGRTTV